MLSLRGWLAALYALPPNLLLSIGLANLAYASASFTLSRLRRGATVPFLRAMAVANLTWAVCCVALAVYWQRHASAFGLAQLLGEAAFVGTLGVLEWRAGGGVGDAGPGASHDS